MRTFTDIVMAIAAVIILAILAYILTHRYFGYQSTGYQTTGYRYYTTQQQQPVQVLPQTQVYYTQQ